MTLNNRWERERCRMKHCGVRKNSDRLNVLTALFLTFIVQIIWGFLWLGTDKIKKHLPASINYELVYFVTSFIVVLGTFPVFLYLCRKILKISNGENHKREKIFEIFLGTGILIGLSEVFFNEPKIADFSSFSLFWHASRGTEIISIFFMLVISWYVSKVLKKDRRADSKANLYPFYAAVSVIIGWAVYQPNCFNKHYNLLHFHAFFNSIYRVMNLQPYSELNAGVYGFYGILMAPFVKLFGGDVEACMIVCAVTGAISILCFCYILDNLIKNIWLKLVSMIAMLAGILSLYSGIYVQLFPHRFVSISFVLAFMIYQQKKKRGWKEIFLRCLVVCALVFNIETGLGCLLAVAGSRIVRILQKKFLYHWECWKVILKEIAYGAIELVSAYCVVGVYNLVVSGEWITLKAALFPFWGNSYVNDLNMPLPTIPSLWMVVLAVLISAVCFVIKNTGLCGELIVNEEVLILTAAIIAVIVQMTYYVNRSVYGNIYVVLPLFVIICAYLVEHIIYWNVQETEKFGNGAMRAVATGLVIMICSFAVMTVCNYFTIEKERTYNRDMDTAKQITSWVAREVPEGTLAIGAGMPEIYSMLGWKTGFYGIDMSDFPVVEREKQIEICEMLNDCRDLFTSEATMIMLEKYAGDQLINFFENHEVVKMYEMADECYLLWRLIE